MKRTFPVFLALILLSGAFLFVSCKQKQSPTGNLTISAKAADNTVTVANMAVDLATSKANLDNQVFEATGWLDGNGVVLFRNLFPKYYWYRVRGWNDYGAVEVFAGVDASVIIWLNSPATSKK